MTSEDIKWNFERIMDPKTKTASRSRFLAVESILAPDRYTVKFKMKKPSGGILAANFGSGVQVPMIAPECVQADGTVTHPIGTGPFEFVEWKANEHVKLKKFAGYWNKGLPYLDEIVLKPVPDQIVRLTSIRTGDLDIAFPLPMDEVAKLMKKPHKDFSFQTDSQGGTSFIHFNVGKPPFDNVKVRQAVALGINKEELVMGVTRGYGEARNQPFPKGSPWYCDVPDVVRDVEKAKALLKEAGYPSGLDVTLTTATTYPQFMETGQIMQAQLKDIGMNVKLDLSDWPTFVGKAFKGEYTMAVAGWAAIADPIILYPALFIPKGTYHFLTGKAYDNPQLSQLIQQAEITSDPTKRKALYTEAVKIIVDDASLIFTTGGSSPIGLRSYVKGFKVHINGLFAYSGGGLQYTWLDK
jgi:ABC-type transport system substrate-binding protein